MWAWEALLSYGTFLGDGYAHREQPNTSTMERFAEFLKERAYLLNVSPKTIVYYQCAFRAWEKHANGDPKAWIVNMRDAGISPVSCNTYICALNAYWRWAGTGLKVAYLKEEEKVLATFTPEQVKRIIAYKPTGRNLTRAWVVAMVILDTGLRISEVLGLAKRDLDFENLLIKALGKGSKERRVPMSLELRKVLFKWQQKHAHELLFPTRNGTRMTVRNFQRDFKVLCKRLAITGVRCSPHTLRHSFAVGYLRAGGNLFYLSKILGHTSVKTTERYLQSLQAQDLQAVHDRLSLLTRRG